MKQANRQLDISSLRAKAQKLLQWDFDAINPGILKTGIIELIKEIDYHGVSLENQQLEREKNTEREGKIASDKYSELYEFSPTGFFTLSKAGEILELNLAAARLLGRPKNELTGRDLAQYVLQDSREQFHSFLKNVFDKMGTETCLVNFLSASRDKVYTQLSGVITSNENECLVSVADITPLKKSKGLLGDLSLIATHTDELAMITDAAGNIEYVNPAFEKLTGYSSDEVVGRNPGRFLQGPETDPAHVEAMREGLKKQVPFSQEILNYNKAGEKFWLSISINPVFNTVGKLEKFIAIEKNITERKELEELREFERQDKETLINSTGDPIWSVKNDFTLVAANKAFLDRMKRLVGVRFKKGDNILSPAIFNEKVIAYWKKNYRKALNGERFVIDAKELVNSGSEIEYFETTFNPILVKDRVEGVACFARNVTEARKNKEAIIDYNRKLQTAQEIAKIGYWEYNLTTQQLYWSPEVYRIWELEEESIITMDRYVASIFPEQEVQKFNKASRQGKRRLDEQYRIQLKDGKKKWIRETGVLIQNSETGEQYYEGTIQDITSQKYYENNILNINEKLRSLTSHLQNVQEEERINISREIHDELGQQLTGIKLDASWLKGHIKIDCPEKEERMNRLISNIDTTIENIRRIATTLRPGVLDDLGLEAAVEWLCSQFQDQTGVKCELETSTVAREYSDAINTAVYRIFQEALTNVTRHAEATEVKTILKEEGNNLILKVIDNGRGIDNGYANDKGSLGITGMKERAWMLDGIFSIKRRREGGTIMSLSIPLKN